MVIHFFIRHHHQAGQHHHRPQEIEVKPHKHFFKFSHNVAIVSFEFLDDRYFLRNLVRLLIRSSVYCGAADAQDMRPDNWRPFSLRPIIVIIIIIIIVRTIFNIAIAISSNYQRYKLKTIPHEKSTTIENIRTINQKTKKIMKNTTTPPQKKDTIMASIS